MATAIHHPGRLDKLLARLVDPAAPHNETLPGIALVVRAKDGSILYSHSGDESFKTDTPSWLASCTKVVTPIALLQLVERGLITLDEPVQRFLPECSLSHVLESFDEHGQPVLRPVTTLVTLRNLLDHTNGLCYLFLSPKQMRLLGIPNSLAGFAEVMKCTKTIFRGPLDNEPETSWSYSPGHEIAGLLLEAVTGQSFEDYLQEHICQPLGLRSTSFLPPLHLPSSIFSRTIAGDSTSEWTEVTYPVSSKPEFHAGGGGLYSTAEELSLILAEVLNDGKRIFKNGDTARLLFESRLKTPGAESALRAFLQYLWATNPATVKAWEAAEPTFGLGYLINAKDIVETGRKAGTGSWWGMSGTTAWVDPKSGIACALFLQAYQYHDIAVLSAHHAVEKQVYECLSGAS